MTLKLVVACILKDTQGRVLITQRPAGKFMEGFWEFPGGKIESGETPEKALMREIKEELGITLQEKDLIPYSFISYRYEEFHALIPVYFTTTWEGEVQGLELQQFCWITLDEISQFPMLPANQILVTRLIQDESFFLKN
ncbi:MAG: (deoxy)nucleoside triphosphate pyrophosphohydrolase [Proteobacteria bacterium]|nr:(deoxy)nucleoside triphosphate pyrophosphohydrolase [Pseudomonadota bacterium]